mmetsp:Transcript_5580/g.12926  ORF Transcript_5580/g.12926 Transcript_5580/m.12926 type:complete len:386 (-) Transcript_5580:1589-2746(-)
MRPFPGIPGDGTGGMLFFFKERRHHSKDGPGCFAPSYERGGGRGKCARHRKIFHGKRPLAHETCTLLGDTRYVEHGFLQIPGLQNGAEQPHAHVPDKGTVVTGQNALLDHLVPGPIAQLSVALLAEKERRVAGTFELQGDFTFVLLLKIRHELPDGLLPSRQDHHGICIPVKHVKIPFVRQGHESLQHFSPPLRHPPGHLQTIKARERIGQGAVKRIQDLLHCPLPLGIFAPLFQILELSHGLEQQAGFRGVRGAESDLQLAHHRRIHGHHIEKVSLAGIPCEVEWQRRGDDETAFVRLLFSYRSSVPPREQTGGEKERKTGGREKGTHQHAVHDGRRALLDAHGPRTARDLGHGVTVFPPPLGIHLLRKTDKGRQGLRGLSDHG